MKAKCKVLYTESKTWVVSTDGKLSRTSAEPTDGVYVEVMRWASKSDNFARIVASSWGGCHTEIYESVDTVTRWLSDSAVIREAICIFDRMVAQHPARGLEYNPES